MVGQKRLKTLALTFKIDVEQQALFSMTILFHLDVKGRYLTENRLETTIQYSSRTEQQ